MLPWREKKINRNKIKQEYSVEPHKSLFWPLVFISIFIPNIIWLTKNPAPACTNQQILQIDIASINNSIYNVLRKQSLAACVFKL